MARRPREAVEDGIYHVFARGNRRQRIYLDDAVRYLAVNPVRAELCARPADWRWSSHGALAGSCHPRWLDHSRLLEYFAAAGGDPAERYGSMVAGDYLCGGSESAARVRHTGE
jgi:hypothetical protein